MNEPPLTAAEAAALGWKPTGEVMQPGDRPIYVCGLEPSDPPCRAKVWGHRLAEHRHDGAARPAAEPPPEPCPRRGPVYTTVLCDGCGGKRRLPVVQCSLYDYCAPAATAELVQGRVPHVCPGCFPAAT